MRPPGQAFERQTCLVRYPIRRARRFHNPTALDMETYEPGSLVETAWVYYKGDHQQQTQPEHPFERPFLDDVTFSVDLVRDNDPSKVLREIMRECFHIGLISCRCTDCCGSYC